MGVTRCHWVLDQAGRPCPGLGQSSSGSPTNFTIAALQSDSCEHQEFKTDPLACAGLCPLLKSSSMHANSLCHSCMVFLNREVSALQDSWALKSC